MKIVHVDPPKPNHAKVGELEYGTVLRYSGQAGATYIKASHQSCGGGIELEVRNSNSLLLNLKSGTLRLLQVDTLVEVLDAEARVNPTTDVTGHKNSWYR